MPYRHVVSKELSELLKSLAHQHRLRIVEELGDGELDVNTLQEILGINHSNVSQHLAVMRAHRIVSERREGRSVYYRLRNPRLAGWLLEALDFVNEIPGEAESFRTAVELAREAWSSSKSNNAKG